MKQIYQCEHCGGWLHGGYSTAEACLEHEKTCDHNKACKTCCTCRHHDFSSRSGVHDEWGHYEDDGEWVIDPGCLVFGDQKFRRNCEKWEEKRKHK